MKQELLNLTKELVRIPSITSDINQLHGIIAYITDLFSGYNNAHVYTRMYNKKPSLIIQNFSGKTADIIMNGHLDVVPVQSEKLFEPVEKDGKLYGRGCGDMKDGCAIIITLMKELLHGTYTDKKISLRLTTDEEAGGADGVGALVNDGWGGHIVLVPDAGSYTAVTFASKGIITINLAFLGKAAHSSRPWKGENALDNVYALYHDLKQQLEKPDVLYNTEEHRSTSVQLTKCHGGIASNILPEHATATINIRFVESRTQQQIMSMIKDVCKKYHATIVTYESGPCMYTDPQSPIVSQFTSIIEKVTGQLPKLNREHGTTDGRYFPDETTVLLYQPTDDHIHTAQEYTTIDHLEDVYNIFKLFVEQVEIERG